MNVENPNRFWAEKDLKNAHQSTEIFADLLIEKVTWQESRMRASIFKVLRILNQHSSLKVTNIHELAKINWTTLKRSLDLLTEKNTLIMEQPNNKQNNCKIYSLKRNRAIVYADHLLNYKTNLSGWRKRKQMLDSWFKFIEKSPENFLDWWIYFSTKTAQKKKIHYQPLEKLIPKSTAKNNQTGAFVQIKTLPRKEIERILLDYYSVNYCKKCFEKSLPKSKLNTLSNIENYYRKFGNLEESKRRYGINANEFKTPLLTEFELKDGFIRCLLCSNIQEYHIEEPARVRGKKRKYTPGTRESSKKSINRMLKGFRKPKVYRNYDLEKI